MDIHVSRSGIHVSEHICTVRAGSASSDDSFEDSRVEGRRDVADGRLQLSGIRDGRLSTWHLP